MKSQTLVIPLVFGIVLFSVLCINIQETYGYIKITSPHKGQQVPLRNNIVVSGTSSSNATLHCTVSVVLNGKQPYQNAIPTGQQVGGANGYSNWTLTTAISMPGLNKITAKFSCLPELHLTRFYSVNVTAVTTTTATVAATGQEQQQQHQAVSNFTTTKGSTGVTALLPGFGFIKWITHRLGCWLSIVQCSIKCFYRECLTKYQAYRISGVVR